jgi:DNA-binding sugar fermentation-stimulating protein
MWIKEEQAKYKRRVDHRLGKPQKKEILEIKSCYSQKTQWKATAAD